MTILTLILTLQDPHDTQHKPGGDHRGKITGGKSPGGNHWGVFTCLEYVGLYTFVDILNNYDSNGQRRNRCLCLDFNYLKYINFNCTYMFSKSKRGKSPLTPTCGRSRQMRVHTEDR